MHKYLLILAVVLFSKVTAANSADYIKVPYPFISQVLYLGPTHPKIINANNFFAQGEKMEQDKRYNDALIYFGKAAVEYGSAKITGKHAESLLRMSDIHRVLKNYKIAQDIVLNTVLKSYSKLGSKLGEMNAYRQLGKIYLDEGRYTESLWFFTQHGIIAQQTTNKLAYIESVIDIARLKIKKKEYSMATADINRAEILAKNANTTKFASHISEVRKNVKDRS